MNNDQPQKTGTALTSDVRATIRWHMRLAFAPVGHRLLPITPAHSGNLPLPPSRRPHFRPPLCPSGIENPSAPPSDAAPRVPQEQTATSTILAPQYLERRRCPRLNDKADVAGTDMGSSEWAWYPEPGFVGRVF